MSLLSDNYGLIQSFNNFTNASDLVIIEKIINGTHSSDEIEVLQNLQFFEKNKNDDLEKIMVNYVRNFKRNLQIQRKKNKQKNIELEGLFKFINSCIERVQTLSLILGSSISTRNYKVYGNSQEIKLIIEIFWKNLLQETWLNNIVFDKIVNKEYGCYDYIKLIENLNFYCEDRSYFDWFLNNLGLFLLDNQKCEFEFIEDKFAKYYKLVSLNDSLKKYNSLARNIKSDLFLVPIKKYLVNQLKNILHMKNKDTHQFIIINKELIFNIYNYCNYFPDSVRNEIIVKIIHYIFDENIINNVELFDKIINFVSDFINICKPSEKKFVNKIFSEILLNNSDLTRNIIEMIAYNNFKQFSEGTCKYLISLIASNELSTKFFEINFKAILTNYILEKYIEDKAKYDYEKKSNFEDSEIYVYFSHLEKIFDCKNFQKLKHDIFKMKLDYQNSKTFFDSYRKSFEDANYTYGFIMNPFVWECNCDQGFIENIRSEGNFGKNWNRLTGCFERMSGKNNKLESKRKILLHPHLGEVKFKMTINDISKEFIVLPIHQIIIEQIISDKITSFDDLNENYVFKKYSEKFKEDIVNSFYKSKFLLPDSVTINSNLSEIEENILDIVFIGTLTNKKILDKEFAYSKNIIISTWISKLLKTSDQDYNQIKKYLVENLEIGFFKISDELVNESLSYLIENDYIEKSDELYKKIVY